MGLSEFEREAKQRLEERTITPSENAWEKLSQQLQQAPQQKKKPMYWYWVAAVLVVGCLAVMGVFKYNQTSVTTLPVVKTDQQELKEPGKKGLEKEIKIEAIEKEAQIEVAEVATQKGAVEGVKIQNKKEIFQEPEKIKNHSEDHKALAQNTTQIALLEDHKVDEVIQTLTELQNSGTEITDATIDSLLFKAQKELRKERVANILNNPTGTEALANSLLEEVEYDLDRSFKDKVFDALQKGVIKVRTAVADKD